MAKKYRPIEEDIPPELAYIDFDSFYGIGLRELRDNITHAIEQCESNGYSDVTVRLYSGYESIDCRLKGKRLETDKERNRRLAKAKKEREYRKKRKAEREEKDRKNYERLKKKFEGE
jgi:hypothetical protein